MTFHQAPESTRNAYDHCDPKYLRDLREAAGMDLVVLARTACLSVAQVRQLESDDRDNLFYSDAIKRQAYKRLLMILGAEPPTVELPEDLRDASKVADAHLTTLDQIVAMSEQPSMHRSTMDVVRAGLIQLKAHKQVLAALSLLAMALVLFVFHGPQRSVEAAPTHGTETPSIPPVISLPTVAPAPVASALSSSPASAALPPVAPATVAASLATGNKSDACTYSADSMPQLTPFVAQKEGRYVYLVSVGKVDICVVDGNKQATAIQMKEGESRSVYGVAPWQVSSPQLSKVQIFFQGGRVTLPDGNVDHVKLIEVPVTR